MAINLSPFRVLTEFEFGGGGEFIALIFDVPQADAPHFPYVGVKIIEAEKMVDGDNGPEKQSAPSLIVGPVGQRFSYQDEILEYIQRHQESAGGSTVLDWGGYSKSELDGGWSFGSGNETVIIDLRNIERHLKTAEFKITVEIRYGYGFGYAAPSSSVTLIARRWNEGVYSWRQWNNNEPPDPEGDPHTTFRLPSKDPDQEVTETFNGTELTYGQSAIPEGTVAGWGGGQHVLTLVYDNIDEDRKITIATP